MLRAMRRVDQDSPPRAVISVVDRGTPLSFSFRDLLRYHGPGSPGGVAHAFKVLERALPLLDANGTPERREITVRTAFGGPGARDGFELVTRAVTEGRYVIDPELARPDRGPTLERFVFVVGHRRAEVTLAVRDGFVPDELNELARTEVRTTGQDERLAVLKREMARAVIACPADEVYDVTARA
jgi:hypothetical protein